MDRRTFSFRQTVRHTDLNGLQQDLHTAICTQAQEFLGCGITQGGHVAADDPPDARHVLLSPTVCWDKAGHRVHVRHVWSDCVSALVPLSALREEKIADIPDGEGTLVLFGKETDNAPPVFDVVGQEATLFHDDGPVGRYRVGEVIQTTLGGLLPQQCAFVLREILPQQGYAPGDFPTGTPWRLEITNDEPLRVDVSRDANGQNLLPQGHHHCRWVSVYAHFCEDALDERLDGHGQTVAHRHLDRFRLSLVADAPAAVFEEAHKPALQQDSGVFLGDVCLRAGQTISQECIDISRQQRLRNLQEIQPQHTDLLLNMSLFGGGELAWNGERLRMPQELQVQLPNTASLHHLPAFEQDIADGHGLWVVLPQQAAQGVQLSCDVLPTGHMPVHADHQLPWLVCQRRGAVLYGSMIGRHRSDTRFVLGERIDPDDQRLIHKNQEAFSELKSHFDQERVFRKTSCLMKWHDIVPLIPSRYREPLIENFNSLRLVRCASSRNARFPVLAVGDGLLVRYDPTDLDPWHVFRSDHPHEVLDMTCSSSGSFWLLVGKNGMIQYLDDRLRLHRVESPNTEASFHACCHNNTLRQRNSVWVVVGQQGTVLTSCDFRGPFVRQSTPSVLRDERLGKHKFLSDVVHNGKRGCASRWVAVGTTNNVITSVDGIAWEAIDFHPLINQRVEVPEDVDISDLGLPDPPSIYWDAQTEHFYLFFRDPRMHPNLLWVCDDGLSWEPLRLDFHDFHVVAGLFLGDYDFDNAFYVTENPFEDRWQKVLWSCEFPHMHLSDLVHCGANNCLYQIFCDFRDDLCGNYRLLGSCPLDFVKG